MQDWLLTDDVQAPGQPSLDESKVRVGRGTDIDEVETFPLQKALDALVVDGDPLRRMLGEEGSLPARIGGGYDLEVRQPRIGPEMRHSDSPKPNDCTSHRPLLCRHRLINPRHVSSSAASYAS